ncbi:hypothetical protein [Micrococcus luteus]|uniref:hypothetical protein n=1 Tax=Micrococcus luteus TaxID=1270 RepID=UPI0019D0E66C|nr:hypothetical protein [Micrococcus luteus]MBN6750435.1 hypothetical protein [Micrococcus luteus]MBN6760739.1 hypothetical protein [Micrococcus luteus]MBN6800708.1 hypothetical protein [Micrococcus luteus]
MEQIIAGILAAVATIAGMNILADTVETWAYEELSEVRLTEVYDDFLTGEVIGR